MIWWTLSTLNFWYSGQGREGQGWKGQGQRRQGQGQEGQGQKGWEEEVGCDEEDLFTLIIQDDHASWKPPREECYNNYLQLWSLLVKVECFAGQTFSLQLSPKISLSKILYICMTPTGRPKFVKQTMACNMLGHFLSLLFGSAPFPTWPKAWGWMAPPKSDQW